MLLFVCLEFFSHLETSLLPVKGCQFWPMIGTYGHWAVRVLKRATPTVTRGICYNGHHQSDTHTKCRASGSVDVTTWLNALGLSRLGFKLQTFRLQDDGSNTLRHRCRHCYCKYTLILIRLQYFNLRSKRRLGVRHPAATAPKSLKQVVTAQQLKGQQQVWVSRVHRDDYYKWKSRATVSVAN